MQKPDHLPVERCPKCERPMPNSKFDKWVDSWSSMTMVTVVIILLFLIGRGAVEMVRDVIHVVSR